jgi:hypothetical protein
MKAQLDVGDVIALRRSVLAFLAADVSACVERSRQSWRLMPLRGANRLRAGRLAAAEGNQRRAPLAVDEPIGEGAAQRCGDVG